MPLKIEDATIIKGLFGAVSTLVVFIGSLLYFIYKKDRSSCNKEHKGLEKTFENIEKRFDRVEADIQLLHSENRDEHKDFSSRLDKKQDKRGK